MSSSSSSSSTHVAQHQHQQQEEQPPQPVPDIMPFTSMFNVVKPSDSEDDDMESESDSYDSESDHSDDDGGSEGRGDHLEGHHASDVGTGAAGAVVQQTNTQMPVLAQQVHRETPSAHPHPQQQQQQQGYATASKSSSHDASASVSASVSAPLSGQTGNNSNPIARDLERMKALQSAFQTNASQWEIVLSNLAKLNRMYHENGGAMSPDLIAGVSKWSGQVRNKLAGETSAMERELDRLGRSIQINNALITASQYMLDRGVKEISSSLNASAPAPQAPAPEAKPPKVEQPEVNLPDDLDEEEILFDGF
jgi:hypothetical protein